MKGPADSENQSSNALNGEALEDKNGETRNGVTLEEAPPEDFSDYMWMANEEEFEQQVMQQLEEEALMEECMLQAYMDPAQGYDSFSPVPQDPMFMYQQLPQQIPVNIPVQYPPHWPAGGNAAAPNPDMLSMNMRNLSMSQQQGDTKLNPNAAEFVPRFGPSTPVFPVTSQSLPQASNS